ASSRAAVPAGMPTSISPKPGLSEAEPRMTSPTRTSPLAVLAVESAPALAAGRLPLGAFPRRWPAAPPVPPSPLEVFVPVLPPRGAGDLAQAYPASPGAALGRARGPVHGDGARAGVHLERAGLLELDVAGRCLDPAFAETAGAAERHGRGVAVHVRARRQV